MSEHAYKLAEEGDWTVIDITGYLFKDFYHFAPQINWMSAHFGDPTYTQKYMKVYDENSAYVSIINDPLDDLSDPVYRFGFKHEADAVNFYLSFI